MRKTMRIGTLQPAWAYSFSEIHTLSSRLESIQPNLNVSSYPAYLLEHLHGLAAYTLKSWIRLSAL